MTGWNITTTSEEFATVERALGAYDEAVGPVEASKPSVQRREWLVRWLMVERGCHRKRAEIVTDEMIITAANDD